MSAMPVSTLSPDWDSSPARAPDASLSSKPSSGLAWMLWLSSISRGRASSIRRRARSFSSSMLAIALMVAASAGPDARAGRLDPGLFLLSPLQADYLPEGA